MEWSKAQLAKRSPPGSEVIIGKMTNNTATARLPLWSFWSCLLLMFPRSSTFDQEQSLAERATCSGSAICRVQIVQSSHITRCTLCTCSRVTLYYKLWSGARVLQVVLQSLDPDLIQWRLNRAKQLRPLGHQTPQCCTISSVLPCECANRCNVLNPTMADLINVRSRARALW